MVQTYAQAYDEMRAQADSPPKKKPYKKGDPIPHMFDRATIRTILRSAARRAAGRWDGGRAPASSYAAS